MLFLTSQGTITFKRKPKKTPLTFLKLILKHSTMQQHRRCPLKTKSILRCALGRGPLVKTQAVAATLKFTAIKNYIFHVMSARCRI